MGSVESRLEGTDWTAADGGLAGDAVCMAGQTPTHGPKKITLKKVEMLNHRIYDVLDSDGKCIFKFKPTPVTAQWFELSSPVEKSGKGQLLCRAAKTIEDKGSLAEEVVNYVVGSWTLYSYVRPAFEGQETDKRGRMDCEPIEDTSKPIYRAFEVKFDHSHKNRATVHPYVKDPEGTDKCGVEGDAILKLEKVKGMKQVYQVSAPDSDSLVAYWSWENTMMKHKIEMEVAKGVDLALVATLAVLVNVVKETEKFPFNIKSALTQ